MRNASRHFARKPSLENLFSKMKFRARGTWASPPSPTIKPTVRWLFNLFRYNNDMNNLEKAKKLSQSLHDEADKLLKFTDLINILNTFGKVSLDGSYSFNLMVDRDLDFSVVIPNYSQELRVNIVKTLVEQPWAYSVNMTDRIAFKPKSNLHTPLGLFVGLTIPFPDNRWNIDIWFTLTESDKTFDQKILSASREQKNEILVKKFEAVENRTKEKGITSFEIYSSVLNL